MSATCPDKAIIGRRAAPRYGFALPGAIFLMVILALLGIFIVRINTIQTGSLTLDVLGTHAYQAARAGTQWGAFQTLNPGVAPACFATADINFPGTSLATFTATVSCAPGIDDELGVVRSIYQIIATACNQPPCPNPAPAGANYAERRIAIVVGR